VPERLSLGVEGVQETALVVLCIRCQVPIGAVDHLDARAHAA